MDLIANTRACGQRPMELIGKGAPAFYFAWGFEIAAGDGSGFIQCRRILGGAKIVPPAMELGKIVYRIEKRSAVRRLRGLSRENTARSLFHEGLLIHRSMVIFCERCREQPLVKAFDLLGRALDEQRNQSTCVRHRSSPKLKACSESAAHSMARPGRSVTQTVSARLAAIFFSIAAISRECTSSGMSQHFMPL